MRRLISSGSRFEAEAGYSRAVVDGKWVFVAGTTGFDYAAMTIAEDPAEQARQAFRNIEKALTSRKRSAKPAPASPMSCACATTCPTSSIGPRSCRCSRCFRSDPRGRDGTRLRSRRPAHENRDRSDGTSPAALVRVFFRQDLSESCAVDVAAGLDHRDLLAPQPMALLQCRGERGRPGPFSDVVRIRE